MFFLSRNSPGEPPLTPCPATASSSQLASEVPLVVDLDGTLLRSDTLVESLFAVARAHPLTLLKVPLWLIHGRARLKQGLAARGSVDARTLPMNQELLEYLRVQRRAGRHLVLASGADQVIAHAVSQECGLFTAVLASDGVVNLTARRKRQRLLAEFGERGFDYIGNSARDLPVWAVARRGLLVAPAPWLLAAARRVTCVEHIFTGQPNSAAVWLGAMRWHHWLKNVLLLVPLLVSHQLYDLDMLFQALTGVLCFCLAASGVYLLNDLLDLSADRHHPYKKRRALASGQMLLTHALVLLPCLWLSGALIALGLPPPFLASLAVYVVLMCAYSMGLKNLAIVDTLVLAMGYSLRILAGGLAVGLEVSPWLLVCSSAVFFGLALLKRYAELVTLHSGPGGLTRVRGYRMADAALVAGLGIAAGIIGVTLLAMFPLVEPRGQLPWPIWLVCGCWLLWTGHMWLMAHRRHIRGDPVSFALHDPVSRFLGGLTVLVLLLTT